MLIRPVVPRFFVPGDKVLLEAVVNNNTAQDVTVDVALQATGLQLERQRHTAADRQSKRQGKGFVANHGE